MSDEQRTDPDRLAELIVDAVDAVDLALEEKTRERIRSAHERLATAMAAYQAAMATASEPDRAQIEQRFGRRLTDLRRQASRMPQGQLGRAAELSRDAGQVPFIEQRAPGKSIQEVAGSLPRRGEAPKVTVGGEIEAWCGPCGGLRTHKIFALVGSDPQQVICQSCGARHGYRTTPARKGAAGAPSAASSRQAVRSGPSRAEMEAEKKQRERMALRAELQAATNVRAFAPKERYRAGEIIEHPEHGRGKIETVTRGSVLVRFASGLRPLDLT